MAQGRGRAGRWAGFGLIGAALLWPAVAGARTADVHVVITVDLQRIHPNAPPDEPLEPAPAIADRVRELIAAHPGFREVTLRITISEAPPNPRVPADFLRLVDQGVDDVVVVHLGYHVRLDSFRATGKAGVQGFVAVHNVAGRRKVASREFTVAASYPGEVAKEAVIQAELAARARGAPIPVEELELGLLDGAVKARLARELGSALAVYHPASLPPLSKQAVQEGMLRMARFLASAPDRREEAIQMLEGYLTRYPASPDRAELERRLRQLKQASGPDPAQDAQRQQERAVNGITRSLTAAELAELFERLVGSKIEVRAFKLDWRDDAVVMTPMSKNQDFLMEGTPPRLRELEADPTPIYVLVVGRRSDPRIPLVDVKVPVVRWLGCPKTACP